MSLGSLGHCDLRQAPPGDRIPPLVVDSHEIAYDLARQFARTARGLGRRLYAGANWRKLRREELGTYRAADGVYLCSAADERRLLDQVPDVYTRDGYTISKWWQERVTRRFAEQHGWDLTVLRPGFIWASSLGGTT